MSDSQIQDWLRQARSAGFSDGQIRAQLQSSGWTEEQISAALTPMAGVTVPADERRAASDTSNQPYTTPGADGQLPRFVDLLKNAAQLFKERFVNFIVISLIVSIVGMLVVGIFFVLSGLGFGMVFAGITSGAGGDFWAGSISTIGVWLAGFLIMVFSISLGYAWAQAAIMLTIVNPQLGVGNTMKQAFHFMLSYWWLSILTGLLTTGAFILFLVPGIIFSIWFSLAIFILLSENVHGLQALLKSKAYIRGYWWAVLGRNLLFSVSIGLPYLLIAWGLGKINAGVILGAVDFILSFTFVPFALCFNYAIYLDLKRLKGADLQVSQKKAGIIIAAILGWLLIPVIILIISSTGISGARARATDAARKADLSKIRTAIILYYDEHDDYPSTLTELAPDYLTMVPTDPKTETEYLYTTTIHGFTLCTTLSEPDPVSGDTQYCLEGTPYTNTNQYSSFPNN